MIQHIKTRDNASNVYVFSKYNIAIGSFHTYQMTEDHIHIHSLGISMRENRNKGFGTQMLKEFFKNYAKPGVVYSLEVYKDNEPAIKIYQKCGFEIVNKSHKYIYRMDRRN